MSAIYFFDDWYLSRVDNLELELGTPQLVPEATYQEKSIGLPWSYPSVSYDSNLGRYRCFYTARSCLNPRNPKDCKKRFLTIESDDGICWETPDLKELSPLKSREFPHEVCRPSDPTPSDIYMGTAYKDPYDSQRRYKWLYSFRSDIYPKVGMLSSEDGYNWRIEPDVIWHHDQPNPGTQVFHDGDQYSILCRPAHGDRRIAVVNTKDWNTFSEPELILHPDTRDPKMSQHYGMVVLPYEDIFVGILWMFVCGDSSLDHSRGTIHGELVYSYDGKLFNRTYRKPFIGTFPSLDSLGSGCIYPSSIVVDDKNKIRIYSGATTTEHKQSGVLTAPKYNGIVLHTLRLDGFIFLEAAAGTGRLTTSPLVLESPDLNMNIEAPQGKVRVQITDSVGQPIEGFTFADCKPFRGDRLYWKPEWTAQKSLDNLLGDTIRIDLELFHARIYAIRGEFEFRSPASLA